MKKLLLVTASSWLMQVGFAQTIFTYGPYAVSKQEFLIAYKKNKISSVDEKKALQDYLNLYINFKLKVQAAKDDRLDTLASQKYDLHNFRNQVIANYLNDETELNRLIKEAFQRSLFDLHLTYVYFPLDLKSDTTAAMRTAMESFQKLNNHLPLKDQVSSINNINNKVSFLDAGFITLATLPYSIENIVYNLSLMEISKPFKTSSGIFIFQVTEKKKAAIDKINTAQILIALPPGATALQDNAARKKADSIYLLLKKGNDFSLLAKSLSDDRSTAGNGGVMEEYGIGKYSPQFESNVFILKNEGDISNPFKTSYGYHIVKLIHKNFIISDPNNENNLATLKQRILLDERIKTAKDKFLVRAKRIMGFKINEKINLSQLNDYTDTFLVKATKINTHLINDNTVLFTIKNLPVKVADWYSFLNELRNTGSVSSLPPYSELMSIFIDNQVTEQYKLHMEEYDPVFKQQMKDYADGNLLFEEMERKVWSKASSDSIELLKYFESNKEKYNWKESADMIIFSCKDESTALNIKKNYEATGSIANIKKDFPDVTIDSSRFELDQLNYKEIIKDGSLFISKNINQDHSISVIKIVKKYPSGMPRTFDQARGLVVNDYQNKLEATWINYLKNKYPVTINKLVLQSISK